MDLISMKIQSLYDVRDKNLIDRILELKEMCNVEKIETILHETYKDFEHYELKVTYNDGTYEFVDIIITGKDVFIKTKDDFLYELIILVITQHI